MQKFMMGQPVFSLASADVLAEATLCFEENMIAEDSDGCSPYGCTCISYEKCCGCLLQ